MLTAVEVRSDLTIGIRDQANLVESAVDCLHRIMDRLDL
jgi:hypothetical protein